MQQKKAGKLLCMILAAVLLLSGCSDVKKASKSYDEGLIFFNEKDYDKADASLNEALLKEEGGKELSKKEQTLNKKIYYALGVTAFERADYEKANSFFEKALAIPYLEKWNFDIRSYQLDAYTKLRNFEKAYQTVRLLRESEDKNFPLIFSEYFLLMALDKEKEAKELMNETLSIKGIGADYNFYRAKAYYFLGNQKEAKEGMEEAMKKEIKEAKFYMGRICEDEQNYEEAADWYEKYRSEEENAGDFVSLRLAKCYEEMNKADQALMVYEEGILKTDGSFLKELRYNEIILLEKELRFQEAYNKCKSYVEDYKDDAVMLKECEFLKSRTAKK